MELLISTATTTLFVFLFSFQKIHILFIQDFERFIQLYRVWVCEFEYVLHLFVILHSLDLDLFFSIIIIIAMPTLESSRVFAHKKRQKGFSFFLTQSAWYIYLFIFFSFLEALSLCSLVFVHSFIKSYRRKVHWF